MENLNNLPPFYSGQKLVCINDSGWVTEFDERDISGPSYNEIVICVSCKIFNGTWQVELKEYPHPFPDNWFWCIEFKPVQEQKFPLIKLSKIIEKELVSAN